MVAVAVAVSYQDCACGSLSCEHHFWKSWKFGPGLRSCAGNNKGCLATLMYWI